MNCPQNTETGGIDVHGDSVPRGRFAFTGVRDRWSRESRMSEGLFLFVDWLYLYSFMRIVFDVIAGYTLSPLCVYRSCIRL
jgi:hypothetical protein